MSMREETWQRHANPWSVHTRFLSLPLLSLAVWSRVWIDAWSLLPVALVLLWIWLNPRMFPPPRRTDNWASMATFGERVYLNRAQVPIPSHHLRAANVLQAMSGVGLPILIYGLYALDLWAVVLGNFWIMTFKAWFVDRMVWLYLDMKDRDSLYGSWLRGK